MIKTATQKEKGVTLLELMITIFVISVGIVGTFGLIERTIQSASIARSRLVAVYLAQEGIELVRNVRDDNLVKGEEWDEGINPGEWSVYYDSTEILPYSDEYLRIDGNGFYGRDGYTSAFKRKVIITDESDFLDIRVRISWREKEEDNHIEAVKRLYDWR